MDKETEKALAGIKGQIASLEITLAYVLAITHAERPEPYEDISVGFEAMRDQLSNNAAEAIHDLGQESFELGSAINSGAAGSLTQIETLTVGLLKTIRGERGPATSGLDP